MLSSVEQAFVGREKIRAPLKTPAWEATVIVDQDHLSGGGLWVAPLRLLYNHGGSVRTCCCTRNFGAFRFLSGR